MTDEILKDREIERFIGSWRMMPSSGGVFELTVNGELLFSKKTGGKHAEPGQIKALIVNKLKEIRESSRSKP